MIIGAFVQGVAVEGRSFAGGSFDWLNAYSVMTGIALVFGYALLGATWLVMKTEASPRNGREGALPMPWAMSACSW